MHLINLNLVNQGGFRFGTDSERKSIFLMIFQDVTSIWRLSSSVCTCATDSLTTHSPTFHAQNDHRARFTALLQGCADEVFAVLPSLRHLEIAN